MTGKKTPEQLAEQCLRECVQTRRTIPQSVRVLIDDEEERDFPVHVFARMCRQCGAETRFPTTDKTKEDRLKRVHCAFCEEGAAL